MAGRTVKIEILGDAKSAQGAFGSVGHAADGFASKIGGIAKLAGVAMVGIGAAVGAAAVIGIKAASDYEESWNKVGEVFDDQAGRIQDWSKTAAQALGLSRSEALATAGDFGNLFTAMGIGTKPAADMSEGIVQLAADLGSFNNMGTPEVLEKIRAGLVGETEPLRSLGVNLDAASIAQKAVNMGLADSVKNLTPAAKAQAAYALILEQTTNAQGDFARTKSGMANSLKVISASFNDAKVAIGERLLPVVAPLIAAFASKLPAALDTGIAVFDRVIGRVKSVATGLYGEDGILNKLATKLALVLDPSAYGDASKVGSYFRTLKTIVVSVADRIGAVWGVARDGFLTFVQALQGNWTDNEQILGLHRVIGTIGVVIREQVIPAVQAMAGWFTGTLIPAVQGVIGFVGQLRDAFGEGGFAGVVALLADRLGPVADQLLAWAGQTLVRLVGAVGQWAGAFLDWIAPMIPPLLLELAKIIGAIGEWAYNTALPAIGAQLAVWGQALIDWIGPRIGPMLEALGALLEALGTWLVSTALPAIAEKLGEWGVALVGWVGPQIPPLLEKLGGLLTELGGWLIGTALPEIVSKLGEWGSAFVAWVGPQIPPLLAALGGLLADLGAWMVGTALPAIVQQLAQWGLAFVSWVATDVLPRLPGALAAVITTIAEWAAGAAGAIAAMGADLIRGLISGIGSMAGAAAQAVVDLFKGAFEAGKNWLLSRSPSRRAAEELGLPIAQGIAIGIGNGSGDVQSSMLRLANDALNAGHSAMQLTGAEIAKALYDGFTREGSSKEIYPFENLFSADVAQALIDMRQTAEKNLVLGQIAGQGTAELEQALANINDLIASFEDEVDTTIGEFMDGANIGGAVAQQWQSLLGDLDGILDGSVQQQLGDTLASLQRQMQFALAGGAPADVIAALQANIDAAQQQLGIAQQAMETAGQAGLVASAFEVPLDKIAALLPQMKDGGLSLIDELVAGVAEGSTNLGGAMDAIQGIIAAGSDKLPETIGASVDDVLGVLQDLEQSLTVDLAEAFLSGSDPSGIEANLKVVESLLGDLQAQADATAKTIKGLNAVSGQVVRPPQGEAWSPSRGSVAGGGRSGGMSMGGGSATFNLNMPSGKLVGQWYADTMAEDALAPVAIGGLV